MWFSGLFKESQSCFITTFVGSCISGPSFLHSRTSTIESGLSHQEKEAGGHLWGFGDFLIDCSEEVFVPWAVTYRHPHFIFSHSVFFSSQLLKDSTKCFMNLKQEAALGVKDDDGHIDLWSEHISPYKHSSTWTAVTSVPLLQQQPSPCSECLSAAPDLISLLFWQEGKLLTFWLEMSTLWFLLLLYFRFKLFLDCSQAVKGLQHCYTPA